LDPRRRGCPLRSTPLATKASVVDRPVMIGARAFSHETPAVELDARCPSSSAIRFSGSRDRCRSA
jgi:hypothetical protein